MQPHLRTFRHRARHGAIALVAIGSLLLTACGPFGDGDTTTPTADVITQPTSGPEGAGTTTEAATAGMTPDAFAPTSPSTPTSFEVANGTPPVDLGTPAPETIPERTGPGSTPVEPSVAGQGTPVAAEQEPGTPAIVEEPGGTEPASFSGSDGTAGATPAPDQATPATDQPFFVPEVATPAPGATPQATLVNDLEAVAVTSCQPEIVPVLTSSVTRYVTNIDVNFRAGPGADCDQIGDAPVDAGVSVTVLSGPVVREGNDEQKWVQVEIDGEQGWIIAQVLDPAP